MQAAVTISGLAPSIIRCLTVVVAVAAGLGSAPAQPAPEGPPMGVGGWRYEKGANDVHLFQCEAAICVWDRG